MKMQRTRAIGGRRTGIDGDFEDRPCRPGLRMPALFRRALVRHRGRPDRRSWKASRRTQYRPVLQYEMQESAWIAASSPCWACGRKTHRFVVAECAYLCNHSCEIAAARRFNREFAAWLDDASLPDSSYASWDDDLPF